MIMIIKESTQEQSNNNKLYNEPRPTIDELVFQSV